MDQPDGPTDPEAILVTGGFIGIALALLVGSSVNGTAAVPEHTLGVIVGLVMSLGVWWWFRG